VNESFEASGIVSAVFWLTSLVTVAAAIMVVTLHDVFKAAVFLALSFVGVAVIFFLLNAEFVGVVQILVYVGAVSILIAFSIMMISDVSHGSQPNRGRYVAVTVSALLLAAIAVVAYNTNWTLNSSLEDPNAIAGLTGQFLEEEYESGDGRIVNLYQDTGTPSEWALQRAQTGVLADSTPTIGGLLVREFILPFETVGLVIVASLIGGLALMRGRKDEPEARGGG
jgi:NADH:ubiquinone oxidoreductase subunit 6 (subunit J)